MREFNLILHFLGFGLLMTTLVAGFVLDSLYRKAKEIQAKATILQTLRPLGLISPFAIVLMLVTGIGNMHVLGIGLFDFGWLSAKIIFFAIAAINGLTFAAKSRQRGKLVAQMTSGDAPADAESQLKQLDAQHRWFYVVNGILILVIISLAVYGRLGGQF